jgi:hypothetical protein
MRTWQVERRKRTRHLIELGGLVVKARVVDLIGDDRATILGALLWMADKLQSDQGEQARELWAAGEASIRGRPTDTQAERSNCFSSSSLMHALGMLAERQRVRSVVHARDRRW